MSEFYQKPFQLKNQFLDDDVLSGYLKKYLPEKIYKEITQELTNLGEWAANEGDQLSLQADKDLPEHIPYSAWGERIDEVKTSSAWKSLIQKAQQEGIVATGYDKKYAEHGRLVQMAKLYLFHPSSAFASCPMAMTDGAAKILELYGKTRETQEALQKVTSCDPKTAWTSGQWMTERAGGSDVSRTSTMAKKRGDHYELTGDKHFTSAVDAQMALALAYVDDVSADKLSLFFVQLRNKDQSYNGVQVNRLKDKLGTRALPTAELTLKKCKAQLIGEVGRGVATVSSMLNITRLYNSICSMGSARRCLTLMKEYSLVRDVFGKKLCDQILYKKTQETLKQEFKELFCLTFFVSSILGKVEHKKAGSEEENLLRLLTPVVKIVTAKFAIKAASECVETFGGAGYVEDVGVSRFLRDSHVFSIWEGATNVLSLDFLRAIEKTKGLSSLTKFVEDNSPDKTLNEQWKSKSREFEKASDKQALSRGLVFFTAKTFGRVLTEINP